jgi:hypothetical protein
MSQPKSGDQCPVGCGGKLIVYCTRRTHTGEFVMRFLKCNACGAKPAGSKSISLAPRDLVRRSTKVDDEMPGATDHVRMDAIPDDIHDCCLWLNGWQLAQQLGVDIADLMELQYGGMIPDPVHIRPLLWRTQDVEAWLAGGCEPCGECPTAPWERKIYMRGVGAPTGQGTSDDTARIADGAERGGG